MLKAVKSERYQLKKEIKEITMLLDSQRSYIYSIGSEAKKRAN